MEQLLRKVLERNDLQGARMVAGGVRTRYMTTPDRVVTSLSNWVEHPNEHVRIAAGLSLGTITVRNPDALTTVMPLVERLANDQSHYVRTHGAVGALELVWLYHYDTMWLVIEDWIERKNDLVRRVAIETMGSIVKGAKINRPSTLKQFIERGMGIIDHLILNANPDLRSALAPTVNEFGLKGRDLISPWVKEWANRSNLNSLSLARDVLELPFGDSCRGIDKGQILGRVADIEAEMVRRVSGWLRSGLGRMEYFTIIVDHLLTEAEGQPYGFWADPYRGCQFRCEFCATRSLAEYSGDSEDEFFRRVVVVANAADTLTKELEAPGWAEKTNRIVRIGVESDPYQPSEDKFQITREMLKVLLGHETPTILQTRSETILRDLDVLERMGQKGLVNVLVTLPTPIEGIRKKVEIGVPSVTARLRCIAMLAKKGVPVGLVLSPIMPQLTDHPEALEEAIRRAAEAGAAFVIPEVLDLSGTAGPKVRFFLESFIPALLPKYEETFKDGCHPDEAYVKRITEEVIPRLAEKYGANRTGMMLTGETVTV